MRDGEWIRSPHNHRNQLDKSRYRDLGCEFITFEGLTSETPVPGSHCHALWVELVKLMFAKDKLVNGHTFICKY